MCPLCCSQVCTAWSRVLSHALPHAWWGGFAGIKVPAASDLGGRGREWEPDVRAKYGGEPTRGRTMCQRPHTLPPCPCPGPASPPTNINPQWKGV